MSFANQSASDLISLPIIHPDWEGVPAHVQGFSTTRAGGFSSAPYDDGQGGGGNNLGDHVGDSLASVVRNRERLNRFLPNDVTFLSQVHGTIVLDAATLAAGNVGDAVFTTRQNTVCAILTADCLPVLFSDGKARVVAAAHAGWRGLAAGVLQNTVTKMRAAGAADIIAWLGPAIGPDEFEVGQDVVDAFQLRTRTAEKFFKKKTEEGKYLADIYGLARYVLAKVGVDQVYGGDRCTVTEKGQFYSYRRDGVTGRMASLIWIAS
ncbi:peptidoglycan editing factor PgeF [Undibacterium sp. Jales W-56]|uniref:peptidoglycan editing factor PgeF n=1 Tax=Undibacterium sp. Jales W-56 TaxID=2897325 RepID=UPI0021D1E886|nr:peptidoglycan editing factor PgeF [Undibacterium sp. Jales W-56]MCU6433484.1 peptidoglycan editing factor PgeF [Undibacterium sp. Jales W-56]